MDNHDMIRGRDANLAIDQHPCLGLDLGRTQSLSMDYTENPYHLALSLNHLGQHHHDKALPSDYHNPPSYSQDYNNELAHERNHDVALSKSQELSLVETHGHEDDHTLDNVLVEQTPGNQLVLLPFQQLLFSSDHQLTVGQEFPDAVSCRRALRETAIACHFEIQTVKSDKARFTAKCAAEGCPWRIHAAKLPGVPTFSIRTIYQSHTCSGINHVGHQQASVQWVANTIEEKLCGNPHYKPKDILEEIHRVHGITLSYKQAWRGKERIMSMVRGSFEEEYRLLPRYCDQIQETNPGSIALVYGNSEDKSFHRLFVSYYGSIYGFVRACMPLIGLDCIPLKNKYLGALLVASGFDGDGALFPLAFGVVDEENIENWVWFLSELHDLLESNTENMPTLTFLSDRKEGLVEAVDYNFPSAFHLYCMHRLTDSFIRDFNDVTLVNLLWGAAQCLTPIDFENKIAEIESHSPEAAFWLQKIPGQHWASAFCEGKRFGHLSTNTTEPLNDWLIEASGLPIVQMMEYLRRQLMTWFNERLETSKQWSTILVPSAEQKVSEAQEVAKTYQVGRSNEAEFPVVSPHGITIVDILRRCCYCREWQVYGLPCAHGAAALSYCRQNVHRHAEHYFTVANYRKAYSETIHPIPDKSLWKEQSTEDQSGGGVRSELVINPPKSLRPPVKQRKRRARGEELGRVKRPVHCSRCHQMGHFRTTCTAPT